MPTTLAVARRAGDSTGRRATQPSTRRPLPGPGRAARIQEVKDEIVEKLIAPDVKGFGDITTAIKTTSGRRLEDLISLLPSRAATYRQRLPPPVGNPPRPRNPRLRQLRVSGIRRADISAVHGLPEVHQIREWEDAAANWPRSRASESS